MSVLDTHRALHFMGIGGAGMSALAELLIDRGYTVSGCDLHPSPTTERLAERGATIHRGHAPEHVESGVALVVSSAIPVEDPERLAAEAAGVPIVRRAELLGAIMRQSKGIAIAGTHGKSTTTTMIGAILEAAGWDPTVLVGGRIRGQEGNVRLGGDEWLVAEADEFDRSFLALDPAHAVITNIEADHLDIYDDERAVEAAFAAFASQVDPDGTLVLGVDDRGVKRLAVPEGVGVVTFGLTPDADVRAQKIEPRQLDTRFELHLPDDEPRPVDLCLPGEHNVKNALGAAAMAWALGLDPEVLVAGLESVRGVERRFEIVYEDEDVLIVDDYAHHPTELEATLNSARTGWPDRRIVAVFQPHLFSRTRDFAAGFGRALALADVAFVTDVYPAREAPIEGVSGRLVADAARAAGGPDVTYVANGSIADAVAGRIRDGDLVITLGAGDVHRVADALSEMRRATRRSESP